MLAMILLALLGHDRFPIREAASSWLYQRVDAALAPLIILERGSCPEAAYRAGVLVTSWIQDHADELSRTLLPTGWTCHPWISSRPPESCWPTGLGDWWSEVECRYLALVPAKVESFEPDWTRYREATRLLVRDLIARRVPVAAIRRLLDAMAREDLHWWATHRPRGQNR